MWIYKVVAFVFLSKSIQDTSASICHEQMHVYNHHHQLYNIQKAIVTKSTLTCFNVSSVLNLHLPPLYEHTVRVYDQELNITKSNVSILPPQAFSRFHQIKTLYLNGIHLKSIQAKAFENLTKVENLHIENNELTELNNDTFLGLDLVQFLDLSGNKIFKMEKGTFLKLNFLKRLHLKYNRITIFDVKFVLNGVWSSVNYLDLSGNPLQKISQRAQYSLTLSNISLTESSCLMMDGKIYTMNLKLSMNRLNTFNCSVFRFASLSNLDLSNNLIDSIFNCDMDLFQVFNLSHNRMEILNTTFSITSKLDLSHNRIKILENLFSKNMIYIWHLDLSYNEISTFNKNIFLGLSSGISVLNMAFNKIQMIPQGFFKNLKIKNLDLSSNKIENFQFGTFDGLTTLEILNVSNNQLLDLDPRLFHSSTISLRRWYFDNNVISSFDANYVVTHFRELELISFDHNSWNCEDLVRITHLFEKHRTEVVEGESFDVQNHYGIACISRVDSNITDEYSFQSLQRYFQNIIDDRVVKSETYNFFNESFKNTAFSQRFNETKFSKPNIQNYTRPFIITTYIQIIIYCFVLFVAVWFYMFLAKLNVDRSEIVTSRLELVAAD